ncbi:probable cytochrome P450 4p3 isoform X1 [Stomoxys calcitrans]|uniref:probable cytochrome P450 4p3 isoform X1 n=1 Tax=Stomoxys calcitrans TaxID=35570 RepID=UPI0027E37D7B|nr:probable cytochrome P450 4p3 isoform X1 [Stomoxys calcitrans]
MILLLILIPLAIIVLSYLMVQWNRDYALTSFTRKIKTIDGSPMEDAVTVVGGFWGSNFDLLSMNLEQMFYYSRTFAKSFKRPYVQYFLMSPVYNVIEPSDAELVLNDSRLLSKGVFYTFLHPFLKTGLLTSTDKKWHTRRRLLTPAFHFNILSQFLDIFKRESIKFIDNLNGVLLQSAKGDGAVISLSELIPRLTLNNVCETALGVCLDDRLDGDEYRQNINEVEESMLERLKNPLMAFDCIYYNSGDGKKYLKSMEKLHAFSSGIIEKRRDLLSKELESEDMEAKKTNQEDLNVYGKRRYAMLDTLLRAEKDGLIDHAGICEEVDTFMFEGFDTTSMNLIFALMSLALYPDMQKKCYEELQEYISDDLTLLDMQQLNNLKYLDCFIKETQRMYPSVPGIARECTSDTVFGGKLLLPKNTQINIHIYDIHMNPKYYDEPEVFRPERFLPSETEKRHPFAFIPFSAGQRNCIGQKFAMLEIKTLLIYVLKNFILEPVTKPESFRFHAGLLIRTKTDIKIKIRKRIV